MAMVVKNNMSAVNTLNVLNANSAALAKDLQQVATGMKVNSAADDNSGYAISERMRVRIRALDQADQNTQNGANMLKVAEGAVSSTVDILKTMKEKAINAANDSNTDSDRAAIQKELNQSIDQIDDNALITYNGKTLVDGSKMAQGVATKTSMTNQSLHESTDGSTKLVDLKNRNGEGLNIQTTDTLTISYVLQGRNYSVDVDIDATKTLDGALTEAAQEYMLNSPAAAVPVSVYNSSVTSANSTFGSVSTQASTFYNSAVGYAATTYNSVVMSATNALSADYSTMVTASSTYGSWYNYASTMIYNNPSFFSGQTVAQAVAATPGGSTALVTYNAASTNYSTNYSGYSSTQGSAAGVQTSTVNSAYSAKTSTIVSANVVLSTSLSTALSTLADQAGDMIPWKPGVDASEMVGKDASGDTVYTANREKAITITAASAGVKYQISGITFSVKDSQGKVKKSVNAVLDNFTESVRAHNKSNDNAINLQVGAKANQTIRIGLTDMRSEALGLKASTGETISVATQKSANAAINVLDNAIQKALDQQTDIGAVANRMEQTSNNLHIARDNVQASESTIRDADMAKAMTSYTKNNILLQAAQSMLAQANQSGSNVLSLLQ